MGATVGDPIVVVGGGLGGLSAAIHLAAAGERVTLLEQNERVGGKLNLLEADGFTFDTGPSLLTMPWVLRDLFAAAGRRLEDALSIVPLDPVCRYFWPDGARFDAWQRLPQLIQEVERLEPGDVAGLLRFLPYAERIYRAVAGPFLLEPFDGIGSFARRELLTDALAIDSFRTVDQSVRSFFRSPYLRQVFNRFTTYNGSSPYLAPATFNLIAYIEFAEGAWHVMGGMYQIARALTALADDLGVEIRTDARVRRILVDGGVARGVELDGGEQLAARSVVANVDPRVVYRSLLGDEAAARRLEKQELSYSGFVLMLGVDRIYEQLSHHNIFFAQDYEREFDAIVGKRVPYADPTVYVCAPSISDPQLAPPGQMNLFVLINAPAVTERVDWRREAQPYRDLVVRKLERLGLEDLGRQIVVERMMTPADIQARYAAPGGAIYGLASNTMFSSFLRPPQRARAPQQLYFTGGGTHPGGGIPLVLLSGRSAAQRVLADLAASRDGARR